MHNENIELTKQRETLRITHDVQMKKLHDHYARQLHDAEQWPDRLQMELNREREQHRIQMTELERRLKENFLSVKFFQEKKSIKKKFAFPGIKYRKTKIQRTFA